MGLVGDMIKLMRCKMSDTSKSLLESRVCDRHNEVCETLDRVSDMRKGRERAKKVNCEMMKLVKAWIIRCPALPAEFRGKRPC